VRVKEKVFKSGKIEIRVDWYDRFNGFIIIAKDENEAAKLARKHVYERCYGGERGNYNERLKIKKVDLAQIKEPVVLLSSYNAG
jgi:hypothetical protein